jgi:DNA-binding response OmpR family regulator
MANRCVLVVEDEADLVATYERLLRRHGFRVVSAGSREAGLAALAEEPPHLLIADLRLPDGDGLDIVRAARALPTPTPVIVVSGFASNDSRDAALAAGASAVLAKPFSTDAFTKLIQSVLADRSVLTPPSLPPGGSR